MSGRAKRVWEHLHSEFTLRVLMFIILLASSLFFGYAVFDTIAEARRYQRTESEIKAIRDSQVQLQANTESILARGESRDKRIDEMISHIEHNTEAIKDLGETLKSQREVLIDRRRVVVKPAPTKRKPRSLKTCTRVEWKVSHFGDKGERVYERILTPIPCK